MSGVAFIDTETLGLDPIRNPIWEIAVIVDDVEHVWTQQVPRVLPVVEDGHLVADTAPYVSRWVLENTRFLDYDPDDPAHLAPEQSILRFCDLVDGRHLVGAVPSFDEERLRWMYRLHMDPAATQFPWHYHLIDVEAMAVGYLSSMRHAGLDLVGYDGYKVPEPKRVELPWNSDDLSNALGIPGPPPGERHTALGDARWAKRMYEAMVG